MHQVKTQGPKSLFSLNTNINSGLNHLHQFHSTLLGDCDYPLLSKIMFLQLVTRQNILIYSSRRAEIKEVWNSLNRKINDMHHSILIIDQQSDIKELMALKGQRRVLLFDLGRVNTQALNQLLNHQLHQLTLLAVEDESRPLRPQLSDLFPLVFRDSEDQEIPVNSIPGSIPFDRERFQAAVAANYNHSIQAKEHQSFFQPYLALLKEKVHANGVTLPHSRWKKMAKVLHLIGVTRLEGAFKCLSPADCILAPECLGRTPQQLEALSKANQFVLLELVPLYGIQRWLKQVNLHFWLTPSVRTYYLSLFQKLKSRPSFYYPVSKYPQTVSLCHDSTSLHYRVKGFDKKLMSDKHTPIDSKATYRLSLKYRCQDNIILHVGVACFDQKRNMISPVQVCRVEESAVTVDAFENGKIVVDPADKQKLAKWSQNSMAYERCIGLYFDGNIDKLISTEDVFIPTKNPYSDDPSAGSYSSISDQAIELTSQTNKQLNNIRSRIIPGLSKVMNHYQGGTYSIGGTYSGCQPEWKQIQMVFKGQGRENNGKQFLFGTKFVRIVMLVNYNSGHPDFSIARKDAEVDFRQFEWSQQ